MLEINVAVGVFGHLVETIQVQLSDKWFEAGMTVNEGQNFLDESVPVFDDDLGALPRNDVLETIILSGWRRTCSILFSFRMKPAINPLSAILPDKYGFFIICLDNFWFSL